MARMIHTDVGLLYLDSTLSLTWASDNCNDMFGCGSEELDGYGYDTVLGGVLKNISNGLLRRFDMEEDIPPVTKEINKEAFLIKCKELRYEEEDKVEYCITVQPVKSIVPKHSRSVCREISEGLAELKRGYGEHRSS